MIANKKSLTALGSLLALGVVSLSISPVAWGQETPDQPTEEGATDSDDSWRLQQVVVTAQKRAENLQEVPLSVSATTGEMLERLHQQDLSQITGTIPNV